MSAGLKPAVDMDLARLEQFVYREARLLDERRWDEWNSLFSPEGYYWVPLSPGQKDPRTETALFFEDAVTRELRARRYRHPNIFSQQPPSRTAHWVSNIQIDSYDEDTGLLAAGATFVMIEYRRERQMVYGGRYAYRLETSNTEWRIASKRVDLVNCDAPLESIHVYL